MVTNHSSRASVRLRDVCPFTLLVFFFPKLLPTTTTAKTGGKHTNNQIIDSGSNSSSSSSSSNTVGGNVNMNNTEKRWICDVCKVVSFTDFDEACKHEEQCQNSRKGRHCPTTATTQTKTTIRGRSDELIIPVEAVEAMGSTVANEDISGGERVDSSSNDKNKNKNKASKRTSQQKTTSRATHSFFAPRVAKKPRMDVTASEKKSKKPAIQATTKKEASTSASATKSTAANNKRSNTNSFFAPRKKGSTNSSSSSVTKQANHPGNPSLKETTNSSSDNKRTASSDPAKDKKGKNGTTRFSDANATSKAKKKTKSSSTKAVSDGSNSDDSSIVVERVVVNVEDDHDHDNNCDDDDDDQQNHSSNKRSVDEVTETANEIATLVDKAAASPSPAVVPTNKKRKNNKKNNNNEQLASIFTLAAGASASEADHAKLLAEQRLVEFQAKRRRLRQQEMERQQRKQQMNFKSKLNSQLLTTSTPMGAAGNTATSSITATTTKKSKKQQQQERKWPDCKYPIPNHVLQKEASSSSLPPPAQEDAAFCWMKYCHHEQQKKNKNDNSMDMVLDSTSAEIQEATALISSPDALDDAENDYSFPRRDDIVLFEAFSKVIKVPTTSATKKDNRLFVDKYGMTQNGYVGEVIERTAQEMKSFIKSWQKNRRHAMERMAEKQRKLAKRKKQRRKKKKVVKKRRSDSDGDDDFMSDDDDYDDDDDDYDEDESNLKSLCLISGPPSSGKSALVHEVARQCACQVLEINTADTRGGQALKNAILEATQSCSSLDMLKKKNQQQLQFSSVKNKKKNPFADSDDDGDDNTSRINNQTTTTTTTTSPLSLTCILIDEVDIVFESEGDAGFWSAIQSLAKTAKCPIFMTAQSVPTQLSSFASSSSSSDNFVHFRTERPSPDECAAKLWQVIQQEILEVVASTTNTEGDFGRGDEDGNGDVASKLASIARVCKCDLRKLLMELQSFLHHDGSEKSRDMSSSSVKPIPSQSAKLQSESDNGKENDFSQGNLRVPKLLSLEPTHVPVDKFSTIKVKGAHLDALFSSGSADLDVDGNNDKEQLKCNSNDVAVQIGSMQCEHFCLIDEETMLILCPPCPYRGWSPSRETRIAPLTICSHTRAFGYLRLDGSSVVNSQIFDDKANTLPCANRLCITYTFDEDCDILHAKEGVKEEREWEDESEQSGRRKMQHHQQTPEEGLELWNKARRNHLVTTGLKRREVAVSSDSRNPKREYLEMQSTLEQFAADALLSSDAALLHDLQGGLPYLSGACRGFGFDQVNGDHHRNFAQPASCEKSRPPREEKLFELGWNEYSYFYGDPECYVTMPNLAKERKRIVIDCATFRGRESSGMDTTMIANERQTQKDTISMEDFLPSQKCSPSAEEDKYLPRPIHATVKTLPQLLWKKSFRNEDLIGIELNFKKKKMQLLEGLRGLVADLFPLYDRPPEVAGDVFFPESLNLLKDEDGCSMANFSSSSLHVLLLDYLPILRSIGLLERVAENTKTESGMGDMVASSRARTRSQSQKKARHHYYDRFSLILRKDQGAMSSTEVGSRLADSLLIYK